MTGAPERHVRRRWPRVVAGVLSGLLVVVGVLTTLAQAALPLSVGEGDHRHRFSSDVGSLRYEVHLPPQHADAAPLPVLMAIHGCGMTGYGWNSMEATTQLDELADREGFIVVYPTQRMFEDRLNCWRSADPRDQQRGAGEPALLAGVAREVVDRYDADASQVHVAGASSGAGTAVILGATYPDVFASVTSVAGGEYGLNQVDPDVPDLTSPERTARQAWAQMGDEARQVPLLVIQGEDDDVVPTLVATRLVKQWTAVGDLVDNGLLDDSLDLSEEVEEFAADGSAHGWTRTSWTNPDGTSLVELHVVEEMGHVWPGPDGAGLFTDPDGPDASALFWDFAQRHPSS